MNACMLFSPEKKKDASPQLTNTNIAWELAQPQTSLVFVFFSLVPILGLTLGPMLDPILGSGTNIHDFSQIFIWMVSCEFSL